MEAKHSLRQQMGAMEEGEKHRPAARRKNLNISFSDPLNGQLRVRRERGTRQRVEEGWWDVPMILMYDTM